MIASGIPSRVPLALAWIAALAAVGGCSPAAESLQPAETRPAKPKQVAVAQARLEPWPRTVSVQGSLLADEVAVIGAKIPGRVESVAVDLGSVVKRGDPLVVLDRSDLNLNVELAQAQLSQAAAAIGLTADDDETTVQRENSPRVELEQALVEEAQAAVNRAQQLLPTRAITGAEYDALTAQLKAAQARYDSSLNAVSEQISLIGVRRKELALARQQLADAVVAAPFDGMVEGRQVAPGEYVQVGQALITLVRSDRLRFTAGVPESKARQVAPSQQIDIHVAGQEKPVTATVSRVSPMMTQTSRALRIEADVPNADFALQAGLFAEADIIVDPTAQALTLPASAVSRFAGVQKVWLVVDGKARQQTVRTGREEEGRVELLDGLTAGDLVVTDAEQGHDGPVIAIGPTPSEQMHVTMPPTTASGG